MFIITRQPFMEKLCKSLGNISEEKEAKDVVTSCDLQSAQVPHGRYVFTGNVQRLRWPLTAQIPSDPLRICT